MRNGLCVSSKLSLKRRMFQSKGQLIYTESGWVKLVPHRSIGIYYRWWISCTLHRAVNMPFHDYHVTVINGRYQDCRQHKVWKKHHLKKISFSYSNEIESDQTSFWLPIKSRELEEIRGELGLSPFPYWPFHLTIANLKGLNN